MPPPDSLFKNIMKLFRHQISSPLALSAANTFTVSPWEFKRSHRERMGKQGKRERKHSRFPCLFASTLLCSSHLYRGRQNIYPRNICKQAGNVSSMQIPPVRYFKGISGGGERASGFFSSFFPNSANYLFPQWREFAFL